MTWTEVFPVRSDAQVPAHEKRATDRKRPSLSKFRDVARVEHWRAFSGAVRTERACGGLASIPRTVRIRSDLRRAKRAARDDPPWLDPANGCVRPNGQGSTASFSDSMRASRKCGRSLKSATRTAPSKKISGCLVSASLSSEASVSPHPPTEIRQANPLYPFLVGYL